jgi:sugar lactone lactonase YvrE
MLKILILGLIAGSGLWAQGLNPLLVGRGTGHRTLGDSAANPENIQPNLLENKELSNPTAVTADTARGIVYICDSGNNRVLAWRTLDAAASGQPADLVIGQLTQTGAAPLGPTTVFSSGLTGPSGLAVDREGNLWVADAGNNRLVRYRRPFEQPAGEAVAADFVLGQPNLQSRNPNRGQSSPSANTLFLTRQTGNTGASEQVGLLFDGAGNLWVTDGLNNRVLRYPASALTGSNGPDADLALGQNDFNQRVELGLNLANQLSKTNFVRPQSLALDPAGRLYVTDELFRVLVFLPEGGRFSTGQAAARVMGVWAAPAGSALSARINETAFGGSLSPGQLAVSPQGVFVLGNNVFVVDTGNHRILRFPPYSTWAAETATIPSPAAAAVIGQDDFTKGDAGGANRGRRTPAADAFHWPRGVGRAGSELLVVDQRNHRLLGFRISEDTIATPATRVIGQADASRGQENTASGAGFYFSGTFVNSTLLNLVPQGYFQGRQGGGIALDTRGNVPVVYVCDTSNNRILGYRNLYRLQSGGAADLVIGQPNLDGYLPNAFSARITDYNERGLYLPAGLAVDADGNLWVADWGNRRVVRFPKPFEQQGEQRADLVLGQPALTGTLEAFADAGGGQFQSPDATSRNLAGPTGLAFSSDGSIAVADDVFDRVLIFRRGGGFTNGQAASVVLGQRNFTDKASTIFSAPRGMAFDIDDGLFVADSALSRVAFFERAPQADNGTQPQQFFGAANASGVAIDPVSGDLWVAARGASDLRSLLRITRSSFLLGNPQVTETLFSRFPNGVAVDKLGNVAATEDINRVVVYFPNTNVTNGANFANSRGVAMSPGMIATVFHPLNVSEAAASAVPLPRTLSGLKVVVDGTDAPLYYMGPGQANFQVPRATRTSEAARFTVEDVATGRILGITSIPMARTSPACFQAGPVASNGSVRWRR